MRMVFSPAANAIEWSKSMGRAWAWSKPWIPWRADGKDVCTEEELVIRRVLEAVQRARAPGLTDEKGEPMRHPFVADWPMEMLSTMMLAKHEGRTTLTVTRTTFAAGRGLMEQGFSGTQNSLGGLFVEGLSEYRRIK